MLNNTKESTEACNTPQWNGCTLECYSSIITDLDNPLDKIKLTIKLYSQYETLISGSAKCHGQWTQSPLKDLSKSQMVINHHDQCL